MLTALNRLPRTRGTRSRAARLSAVALVLWLVFQTPVIWLGNPFGALLALTVVTWGAWAFGVSMALLPSARLPLLTVVASSIIAPLAIAGFVFAGLLFLPAIGISLALWLSWREPGGTAS